MDQIMDRFSEDAVLLATYCRLLRVCYVVEEASNGEHYNDILLNLRFLFVDLDNNLLPEIPSYLWNMQTLLILRGDHEGSVFEIWKMPLLRHVITCDGKPIRLLDPPPPLGDEVVVLENLQTLDVVKNLNLREEVVKRIPNIKVLNVRYYTEAAAEEEEKKKGDYYCLNNLHRLNKLQVLCLVWIRPYSPLTRELCLPHSLKQLTLKGMGLPWEEMASKIGCLPLLQVLKLEEYSFIGSEWKTVEGQFSSLKYLKIEGSLDLEQWIIDDNTHFPRLEHLVLRLLKRLKEIPSCIGDIPTLKSITVDYCSESIQESAQIMLNEQHEYYDNQVLRIRVLNSPYIYHYSGARFRMY